MTTFSFLLWEPFLVGNFEEASCKRGSTLERTTALTNLNVHLSMKISKYALIVKQ